MRFPSRLSIAQKLIVIVMVPSSAALILAAGVLITYDYRSFERTDRENLLSGARIVGANCAAALMFDDSSAAKRFLSALAVHEDIVAAYIYTRDGRVFAQYLRDGSSSSTAPASVPAYGFHRSSGRLMVVHPIVLEGERVGAICIESDLSEMWVKIRRYVLTVSPVLFCSFLLAYLLQRSLSPLITLPLTHLAETAGKVTQTQNYALRARTFGQDEIGHLIDAFNDMLAQIQDRDAALNEAQTFLEERVRERTHELQEQISERELAQETLRKSEAKYRELVQNANSIILRMTPEGVITFFNEFAQMFFGYSEEEILGKNVVGTIVPVIDAHHRDLSAMIQDIGRDPEQFESNENENIRRNGERVWVSWTNKAVEDAEGHVVEIFCVGNDITRRKLAEEALRKAKEDAEAANVGLEEAIERANRMAMQAEMANSAKSAFLANMSHEIRTPMNGIIGMVHLLLDTSLSPEQREFAQTVRASSESLLELINEILDFSKIEAGKLILEHTAFDIRATVEDAINLLWVRADDKGLQLGCMVYPEVHDSFYGDPGRLRQILINLVGNAIKFTEQGDILIEVLCEHEDDKMARIRFEITDSGIGIPEDRRHLLFRSFSQVDASTTRKFGGTGLGLAISKQLVELMGGTIDVYSEPGIGSKFWFVLTLEKQAVGDRAPQIDLRHKRVLVVDGNEMQRRILAAQLQSWLCRVEESADGETALLKLQSAMRNGSPFEFVVMDTVLADLDVETVCQRIKADASMSTVRIILLCLLNNMPDADQLNALGASACLPKPIKRSQLYDSMVNILSEKAPSDESGPQSVRSISTEGKAQLRILLVEDNAVNQKVALKILEKHGYHAALANNGKEAVAACAVSTYDIILMDVQMPEMDGYEATGIIRKQEEQTEHRSVIIAMTAHAMKGDREQCIDAGMDDYVPKPVNPQTLIGAIERYAPEGAARFEEKALASVAPEEGDRIFDRNILLRRVEGDESLVGEVLIAFIADCPKQFKSAHESFDVKDGATLRRAAHSIKGAAANIGALSLSEAALQLETAAYKGDFTAAQTLLERLESERKRLWPRIAGDSSGG